MVMLLVFVGQAMASAVMPCQMDMQNQSHHMVMDGLNDLEPVLHHGVDSSDIASMTDSSGCIESDCYCPMGGCASTMLLTASHLTDASPSSSQKINHSLLLVINQIPSSLYRPPISR